MRLTRRNARRILSCLLLPAIVFSAIGAVPTSAMAAGSDGTVGELVRYEQTEADGNVLLFDCGNSEVRVEFCTERTVRVQLSAGGSGNYRPDDPEYYMVQKNEWAPVQKTVSEDESFIRIKTSAMEIRVQKNPFRIGMYDLDGRVISKDSDTTGMYWGNGLCGVRKTEGSENAGGIFGFGSGDQGRRSNLNRYNEDFSQFTMSHGRLVAPFFMSSVGYGVFLNTIEKQTTFYKQGGGFQTAGYLDYYFMYGPDFKTILNEYAEITGRMEMYGKWAHGFMLSKYGNDNATQEEFLQWLHTLRDQGYPTDCYVFDYGWRGDVADNGGNQTGAGQKFGKQMWSNDKTKFPDIAAMFEEADALGFHVGLHNNAGTPEASGGKELYKEENNAKWVKSYMDSVITTGYGDWFWPDEFDVLGSNTAPVFSSKGAYEAWQEYTDQSRPMFMTRGSYAGQHYATAWSGDIEPTSTELKNQIGFSIDAGLVGYWTVSHDLGGFMRRPSDALYTRWVSEFGAWNGIMRTHGHDGREPWTYDETASETLKKNLKIRYSLYPYTYSLAWQGYSQGVPMMRAMLLEDGSQYNSDAWNLNEQYYYGDWFLVAPASATNATTVSVWLPPETTWYDYATGERYEGGKDGKTITVAADLDEIPVFVKAGAIVPMGPDIDYTDEKPLDPLTLDIYPHEGTTSFTLYEDDGETREYITKNAYSTTEFESTLAGSDISFLINAREDHNPAEYLPDERSYNLKFNHVTGAQKITVNGAVVTGVSTLDAYNSAEQAYYIDDSENVLYVKTPDTGKEISVKLQGSTVTEPELGEENQGVPPMVIRDGDRYELEDAVMSTANTDGGKNMVIDTEWKGYTGSGFAKGFKFVGDSLEFKINILQGGDYNLSLRVNCGKKNSAQYDNSPRQGTLYIDGTAYPQAFTVTDTWGNSSTKAGDWRDYVTENVPLTAGEHTVKFVVEGDTNPGNYNLDSLTFNRIDRSVDAFAPIEGENADLIESGEIKAVSDAQNGKVLALQNDGAAKFAEVRGTLKSGITMRVRSSDGGTVTVFENGVGDKVLTGVTIPADGAWHTINVSAKDTDVPTSDIWLSFTGGAGSVCEIDWWRFTRKITAYQTIEAESADERQGINIKNNNTLNNIENGDWAMYRDIDFGSTGPTKFNIRAALGSTGAPGVCSVHLDSPDGEKIAEAAINQTANWDTYETFSADCSKVTGIHNVYLVFSSNSTKSICDVNWLSFEEELKPDIPEDIAFSIDISDGAVLAGDKSGRSNITWNANVQIGENATVDKINESVTFKSCGVYYGMDEAAVKALADGRETSSANKLAFAEGEDIDVYTVFGFRLKNVAAGRQRAAMFYITYEYDGILYTAVSDCVTAGTK